jgi:cardiolipin synthase
MNWLLIFEIVYVIILVLVCLRIIYDTHDNSKTLAYLLLAVFVPIFGVIFYFSFGINYRKRKMYTKKIIEDEGLVKKLEDSILRYSQTTFDKGDAAVQSNKELAYMLVKDKGSALTADNAVKLLINGEMKFPEVLKALESANHHIHFEYYIYEDDEIGRKIEEVLIRKAKEGVEVRFIYDDFGSRTIRKKLVPRLIAAGVQAFAFHEIIFIAFANRLNYRNHRKIIIVDGITGFVGGINVSDRYINKQQDSKFFWRDTHLRIDGAGVQYLQTLFIADWNFCSNESLEPNQHYFPDRRTIPKFGDKVVQIAASGPDCDTSTILFSMLQVINGAKEEILISTPYFIPGESIMNALLVSSLGGLKVKLLVPYDSDSVFVNAAASSYYNELLKAGVDIYLYTKGFMHAKTMIADRKIAVVGTANMDHRSFDLNFEVNAIVYDEDFASELRTTFMSDLKDSIKIDQLEWENRPVYRKLLDKIARLVSPML